jgi:hypothetical protein
LISTTVTDSGAGYTYNSTTIRQARASSGNQINFVSGLSEDGYSAAYYQRLDTNNVASGTLGMGIGLDTTTAFTTGKFFAFAATANFYVFSGMSTGDFSAALGYHFLSANETADANVQTFNNGSTAALSATFRM